MNRPRLLIVEDQANELQTYLRFAAEIGYEPRGALDFASANEMLQKMPFDILLTDVHLSNRTDVSEGFDLLRLVRRESPAILPIMTSSDPRLEVYQMALKEGALGFIRKPLVSSEDLHIAIVNAMQLRHHRSNLMGLRDNPSTSTIRAAKDGIVLSQSLRTIAQKIAHSRKLPAVIYGETGTGKEEFARLIHRRRREVEGEIPFVAVNCANLNSSVAMSTLFGHRKGAFTGALNNTVGYIGEADGGILFMDEIHTLEKDSQQRLLRTLNDGSYEPVGSTKTQYSRFQLLAASTKDLDAATEKGEFLLDLRMRITGVDVLLPPLRERKDDMDALVRLFFAREVVKVPEKELQKIVDACRQYYWQGNIRQLFGVLQALVVMSAYDSEELSVKNLPVFKTMYEPERSGFESLRIEKTRLSDSVMQEVAKGLCEDMPLDQVLETYEKLVLKFALARHASISETAAALDISRSTFALKRQKYGLQDRP
ncbi:MAG TPA: sigma 54-interacting transcriptional regulator [Oligoflexus sp.]|nr:sigma 54-interacting transcriptional regulator [Oligoflexus sp.]